MKLLALAALTIAATALAVHLRPRHPHSIYYRQKGRRA